MTWLAETAPAGTAFGEVLALRPELAALYDHYMTEIWAAGDPVVLELCRLRIAAIIGDADQQRLRHDSAVAAGLSEQQVAALAAHDRSPLFTDHQRACLAYAEQYVVDVHGLTDADAAAVKRGMGDPEFVAFTIALGMFDGVARMRLALGVAEPTASTPIVVHAPAPARTAP